MRLTTFSHTQSTMRLVGEFDASFETPRPLYNDFLIMRKKETPFRACGKFSHVCEGDEDAGCVAKFVRKMFLNRHRLLSPQVTTHLAVVNQEKSKLLSSSNNTLSCS